MSDWTDGDWQGRPRTVTLRNARGVVALFECVRMLSPKARARATRTTEWPHWTRADVERCRELMSPDLFARNYTASFEAFDGVNPKHLSPEMAERAAEMAHSLKAAAQAARSAGGLFGFTSGRRGGITDFLLREARAQEERDLAEVVRARWDLREYDNYPDSQHPVGALKYALGSENDIRAACLRHVADCPNLALLVKMVRDHAPIGASDEVRRIALDMWCDTHRHKAMKPGGGWEWDSFSRVLIRPSASPGRCAEVGQPRCGQGRWSAEVRAADGRWPEWGELGWHNTAEDAKAACDQMLGVRHRMTVGTVVVS